MYIIDKPSPKLSMIAGFRRLKLSQQLLLLTTILPVLLIAALILYAVFMHEGSLSFNALAILIVSLIVLVVYIIFMSVYARRLSASIAVVGEGMTDLASGKFNGSINLNARNELGLIADAFNTLKEDLRTKTEFAEQVKSGNLELAYRPANNTDRLGHALVTVRENLLRVSGEEEKRKWTAEGLAKFAEVLRSNKNLKELSNDIIINLAKVLKANQGAIFLIHADDKEKDPVLNLEACYAYNRTKYFTRQIAAGEGLIGQTFLEKRTTYLKKVPADFIRITSGLGDAPPNHILIVPLKMNEEIVGVVELASFKDFSQHEIEFVEKIGESIAHSIISYRTAEHTKILLDESQARTEQLRSQEEELKQNQEELQATQEEISRKYDALFAKLTDLNHQSRLDQLRSITSTKKRNIEYYFDIIRNQIITFSEDRMIIEAVKAFRSAFRKIDESVSPEALKSMRQALKRYYTDEFIPRLNDNSDWIESVEHYLPEETKTSVLQYHYIAHNPHPTGKKSLLDNAGDGSEYSKMHATYHPVIRHFLEKFGYYDIFLLDPETGDMVYSVFKEVDFATSLLTGVYHKTNFGQVVKEAIASTDPDFVRLIDFEPYDPSYRAPASFIASPVYEGTQKVGILVFQMPINKISQILTGDNKWREDGLGDSGETIMVGKDHKLRSISRDLIENQQHYLATLRKAGYDETIIRQIQKANTSILLEKTSAESVTRALTGYSGTQLERNDYGVMMLNAFAPLEIPDVQWIIMSMMKEEEASMRINDLKNS